MTPVPGQLSNNTISQRMRIYIYIYIYIRTYTPIHKELYANLVWAFFKLYTGKIKKPRSKIITARLCVAIKAGVCKKQNDLCPRPAPSLQVLMCALSSCLINHCSYSCHVEGLLSGANKHCIYEAIV